MSNADELDLDVIEGVRSCPTHTLRASGDGCVSWCDLCTGGSPQLRLWYRLQAISEAAKPISKESMGILRVRLANVTEMIKNEEGCQ